jgi:cytochrome c biogenesis factor
MSLTKNDLSQISTLFNQGFEQIVIPYVDKKIEELRGEFSGLKSEFRDFKHETQENFFKVYEKMSIQEEELRSFKKDTQENFFKVYEKMSIQEKELRSFKKDTQENFLIAHEKIDENTRSVGHYYQKIDKRVTKLELAA